MNNEETINMHIDKIDHLLDELFNKMKLDDYIDFIKSDKHISCYDHVLSYIDLRVYPAYLKRMLKDDLLNIVEEKITNKLKELND